MLWVIALLSMWAATAYGQAFRGATGELWYKQVVFVWDSFHGSVRKLERYEVQGQWGGWVEAYCEAPHVTVYRYMARDWPKRIADDEVRRLLGSGWYGYFDKRRKVAETEWWNLSGRVGYSSAGICRMAPKE